MLHTPAMHTQPTLHNVTTTSEHHTPHRLTPSMYNSEHYCVYCAVKCLPTWKCPNSTDAVNCEIIWQSISDTWKWSMSNTCLDYKPWPECFKLKTSHMVFTTNVCTFLNHSPSYFCVILSLTKSCLHHFSYPSILTWGKLRSNKRTMDKRFQNILNSSLLSPSIPPPPCCSLVISNVYNLKEDLAN